MHFLKRSCSFTRFRVTGKFAFAREKYQEYLEKNAFRELSELKDAQESIGWVSPDNFLKPAEIDEIMLEPYFQLVMRVDRRKVGKALLSAHLAIEEKAALQSSGKNKLSLNQKRELRQSVHQFLLEKTSPSNAFYKALWNFKSGICYLFCTSRGVQNRFSKLFSETFPLQLEALTPWMLAVEWAQENNAKNILNNLTPTPFMKSKRIQRQGLEQQNVLDVE
ncbi:MAG: hypothetical protein HUU50_12490 [Candidatus Brocadiae bacterium]|nr:hypothetical protein [Candidatus Brocadiia bacterium]